MKHRHLKKILISASTVTIMGTVATLAVYEMYKVSKSQAEKKLIIPQHTTINQFFQPDTFFKEAMIAGEKGWIVNKGPVRITTAYKSLFNKESLEKMANWIYKDINWTGNAISLKNITFTTGIDKTEQGTTKGFHTSGREGSSIYISPDAFEDLGNMGDDVFQKISRPLIDKYRDEFKKSLPQPSTLNPTNIDNDLISFLQKQFNGQSSIVSKSGSFAPTNGQTVHDVYKNIVDYSWDDNFMSTLHASQLQLASSTTILGDGYFTSPERLAYLSMHNKLDAAFEKLKTKLAFNSAYKLLTQATGGDQGLGNTYLAIALQNIIFKDGPQKDESGNPIMYSLRPRKEWDKVSGVTKNIPNWNGESGANLPSSLKSGYFKNLNQELNISANATNLRTAIYQLFLNYFDNAMTQLNTGKMFNAIKSMWKNKTVQATNAWIKGVRNFAAPDRVRWILTGEFPNLLKLNVLESDIWLLSDKDRKYIQSLSIDDILSRQINIDSASVYGDALEHKTDLLDNKSIANYYRNFMFNSMKYTISHEYGHHETMWSTYGIYGNEKSSKGLFDDTISLYSETNAAKGEDYTLKRTFDELRQIAGSNPNQPVEQGVRNALDIMMMAGDKYSSTWTPSYFSNRYYGFLPDYKNNPGKWTFQSEGLFQPSLIFGTDANGAPKLSIGKTQKLGDTPISFATVGVDSTGKANLSHYLFTIDKSRLSPSNPMRNDSARLKDFLELMITPDQLLYGYQVSKWLLQGHRNGDQWSKHNRIPLPSISTLGLKKATSQYSTILAQDPYDKKAKLISLFGILVIQFGLTKTAALEMIEQIDEQVAKLYDTLTKKHPNLFEDTQSKKRFNNYSRAKIIFNQVIENTRSVIKGHENNPYPYMINKEQILYDPKTISYKELTNHELTSEEISKKFDENKTNKLVKKGTVVLGSAKTAYADYTGSYPEFMTRILNQMAFRPDYDAYRNSDGTLDTAMLVKSNEGWYDDINRFYSQGLEMYKIGGSGADASSMTKTGAKLINWFRSMLGLHVKDITKVPMQNNIVDYDSFDKSIEYADPLQKIFTNSKSKLTTAWGWMPDSKVAKYKYIILTNKLTHKEIKIPITTKNTSNLFYYEDMNKSKRHKLNSGFTQWVANWEVVGNYMNADIKKGKYDFKFGDINGNKFNPYDKNDNTNPMKKTNHENDYPPILSRVEVYIDPTNRDIEIEVI